MKNNFTKEILTSSVLIVLVVLLLNPFNFWMPDTLVMYMLAFLVACFALFAIFVMREKVVDERELGHRTLAGRVAFLVGSAFLTLGIIFESLEHKVDVWLVVSLVAMILSKFGSLMYSSKRK